ncbi:hypothetical protein [Candidatus Protochlamydia phocaeensis]|uniref:hypothetical protein n=1 Tax=Candidatus Protochlamydia phocaeensis TaxID=1414722 RepID=UPI000837CCC2|nr:hypothetical protein [Candidatus Protochlamydia phocaeensis]
MKTCIQVLHLDQATLYFFFDQDHLPAIQIEGVKYTSLYQLCRDFPHLLAPKQIEKMAKIANFLIKGLEFQYIENINAFKEDYFQRLEAGQTALLQNMPCLNDYGIYDVSIMHHPKIHNGKLIFFVKQDYTHLPYKASLDFPLKDENFSIHYELLPAI